MSQKQKKWANGPPLRAALNGSQECISPHYNDFPVPIKGVVNALALAHHSPMISLKTLLNNPWFWVLALVIPPTFYPVIDITVSRWFYDPAIAFFPLRDSAWAEWVRKKWPFYMFGLAGLIPILLIWGEITKRPKFGITRIATLFLLLSLALGPGLLVNYVLKDHWGRPRPASITQFGGPYDYRPPVLPGGPCPKNCAFPSGHASLGFWLVAPALLTPQRWRRRAVGAALLCGGLVGFIRIAEGGHFLSDVMYAGIITVGVTHILYRLLILPSTDRVTEI